MNIYFDTEFYIPKDEWGVVRPISIGAIREDGASYYAEIAEFDWDAVPKDDWLRESVKPLLRPEYFRVGLAQIRRDLAEFAGSRPQFWAYYGSYDWVAMCTIMGGFMNLPAGWSKAVFEIKQYQMQYAPDLRLPKQNTPEHHALNDAVWNRDIMHVIRDHAREAAAAARFERS